MELFPAGDVHFEPVDAEHFTGQAWLQRVLQSAGSEVRIFRVHFEPGSRTHWHLHTGAQLLYVEKGTGRVQKNGEETRRINPGDTVYIAPGEKHWHGAAADGPMTHLAVNFGGQTKWMEPVTDDQYSQ